MIPVDQRHEDDCMRACIASVLEMDYEDVPDFIRMYDGTDDGFYSAIRAWFWSLGMLFLELPPAVKPVCYYIAGGNVPPCKKQGRAEGGHAVVMFKDQIVHDPCKAKAKNGTDMRVGIKVDVIWVVIPVDVGNWVSQINR